MKTLFTFLLCAIALSVFSQDRLTLKNNIQLSNLSIYGETTDRIYFKDSSGAYKTIMLSDIISKPSEVKQLQMIPPEIYMDKFRKGEVTGLTLELLAVAGAIVINRVTFSSLGTYRAVTDIDYGVFGIGVAVQLFSFSNLKKRFVFASATPYSH